MTVKGELDYRESVEFNKCECVDPGCDAHMGEFVCGHEATHELIDEDLEFLHVDLCEKCAKFATETLEGIKAVEL